MVNHQYKSNSCLYQLSMSTGILLLSNPLYAEDYSLNIAQQELTTQTVNIENINTLPSIVVTATRIPVLQQQASASTSIVTAEKIQDQQLQINLSESLAQIPGIQVQNRQNYAQDLQLSMRGFGARSTFGVRGVRLYVDDIPATMPDGQGQTSNIDLSTAQQIEVITGPLSAIYGNSSGGAILVTTEEGSSPASISVATMAASDLTYRYTVKAQGTGAENASPHYVISHSRINTAGYRQHSQTSKALTNAKLVWQLEHDNSLKLIINQVYLEAQDPLGLTREIWRSDPKALISNALSFNTRKTVDQLQGGLIYEQAITDTQTVRALMYYGQRDTVQYQAIPVATQMNPNHAGGVIDLGRNYFGTDLRWTANDLLTNTNIVTGLSYDELREQRQGFENYLNATQLGVKGRLRRDESNRIYNLDPYLQATWKFLPAWRIDGGLRYSAIHFISNDHYINGINGNDSGQQTYQQLLPSIALNWQPHTNLNLYSAYSQGFETPTFNEISYRPDGSNGLNLTLKPASSDNYELGIKTSLYGGLMTSAIFYTQTDDEILAANNLNGRASYKNAGKTRRQGLELAWNKKLPANLELTTAYTYIDAIYNTDIYQDNALNNNALILQRGHQLAGIASQSAYAALNWTVKPNWQAGLELRYMDKIYVNDSNTDAAPAYTTTGIHTGYQWLLKDYDMQWFARVDNLFNRQYVGSVIVNEANNRFFEPATGRTWAAGLCIKFK